MAQQPLAAAPTYWSRETGSLPIPAGTSPPAFERAQLFLDLESEIERQQKDLAAVDRAALVRRERREIMPDRDDRDRLRHPVHRRDVGELGPVAEFLQIAHHGIELARKKAVGIGEREQQRLQVDALGRHLRLIVRDRVLVQRALARKRVDRVGVQPRLRRHRRIRQIAVDQDARRALQRRWISATSSRFPASRIRLFRFVDEQALVGDRKLVGEAERGLRGLEALRRTTGATPSRIAFRAAATGWSRWSSSAPPARAARIAHRDAIDRRQRIADDAGGVDRIAREQVVEPREHLGRTGFRRIGRTGIEWRQAERERHRGRGEASATVR